MDRAERISRIPWFHSIDLGDGVVTPGTKSLDVHAREAAAFFDPISVAGASVIDIGAWNGAYSFEAKRRGAARVLATDSFAWTHPGFRGREGFDLAREATGLDVESELVDLAELTPDRHGAFDVVLLLGVFYHRENPLEALARAAALAKEVLVVETHIDLQSVTRPAMVYYPGEELGADATNWWGPNALLMSALLKRQGFERVDATSIMPWRGIFHAWRSDRLRRADPPAQALPPGAVSRRTKLKLAWRLLREGLGLRRGESALGHATAQDR